MRRCGQRERRAITPEPGAGQSRRALTARGGGGPFRPRQHERARGNAGRSLRPQPRVRKGECTRAKSPREPGGPAFPHAMGAGLLRALPGGNSSPHGPDDAGRTNGAALRRGAITRAASTATRETIARRSSVCPWPARRCRQGWTTRLGPDASAPDVTPGAC